MWRPIASITNKVIYSMKKQTFMNGLAHSFKEKDRNVSFNSG